MGFRGDLVKGSTTPIVLKLLAEREMYGYEIVKIVNDRTNGALRLKEGTLYPCLHQLEADGFLRSSWFEAENGKPRKYYRATRKGKTELKRRTEEWTAFSEAVGTLLRGASA